MPENGGCFSSPGDARFPPFVTNYVHLTAAMIVCFFVPPCMQIREAAGHVQEGQPKRRWRTRESRGGLAGQCNNLHGVTAMLPVNSECVPLGV